MEVLAPCGDHLSENSVDIASRETTPLNTYLNRRNLMRAGILATTTLATGFLYRRLNSTGGGRTGEPLLANLATAPSTSPAGGFSTDEKLTPLENVTHYNNFYEFSTDKEGVAPAAERFVSKPWQIAV